MAPTYQSSVPIPAIVTAIVSAKLPIWPSTFEIATSRSQSRASNSRISPNATDRMMRLSPPSAVPTTTSLEKLPVERTDADTRHGDDVRDDADDQPQSGVGADDPRGLVLVGLEDVAEHDPREPEVGDEPDDARATRR